MNGDVRDIRRIYAGRRSTAGHPAEDDPFACLDGEKVSSVDLFLASVVGHLVAGVQRELNSADGQGLEARSLAERLRSLVLQYLPGDPAVVRMLATAGDSVETNRRTMRRVELALEATVSRNVAFAKELRQVVQRIEFGANETADYIALDSQGVCTSSGRALSDEEPFRPPAPRPS